MKETTINLKDVLGRGLTLKNNPRNYPMLVDSTGMFVDSALESVEQFTRMTMPDGASFTFPYPQLFVLSDYIILCNNNQIWEWGGSSWTSKISGLTPGTTWTCVDRKNYLIFSNMQVTVIRNGRSGEYELNSTLPFGSYGDFNGQLCVGSPNVAASGNI